MTNRGASLGKTWLMKSASMVAFAECREGKAPNTTGDAVNPEVYISKPNSLSMAARPAGEPGIL
jgi:hypothetical protein